MYHFGKAQLSKLSPFRAIMAHIAYWTNFKYLNEMFSYSWRSLFFALSSCTKIMSSEDRKLHFDTLQLHAGQVD
jgi:hypothetical protein